MNLYNKFLSKLKNINLNPLLKVTQKKKVRVIMIIPTMLVAIIADIMSLFNKNNNIILSIFIISIALLMINIAILFYSDLIKILKNYNN
jgi:hypothetical protein